MARQIGFLYAVPDGLPWSGDRAWTCGGATAQNSTYLRGLLEEAQELFNVDPDRIFIVGVSDGGFMTYRMACDHPDVLTAVVSGEADMRAASSYTPTNPVHMLAFHGTADGTVAYQGSVVAVRRWAELNGCDSETETLEERFDFVAGAPAETAIARYPGCDPGGSAELWTMHGAGHIPNWATLGPTTAIAYHLTDWLLRHPRRPSPQASFTVAPETGPLPLEVTADGSGSTAPDGVAISEYYWSFGDEVRAEGATASYTFSEPGRHSVSLQVVTDDQRVSVRERRAINALCPSGDLSPWTASEVGAALFPSSARPEESPEKTLIRLCAGGSNIGGREDSFLFVQQEVFGNFQLTVEVAELQGGQQLTKVGILFRAGLAEDGKFAGVFLERSLSGVWARFRYRAQDGGVARSRSGERLETSDGWLRIERRGNLFSGSSSTDGETWSQVWEQGIEEFSDAALLGIGAVGNDADLASDSEPLQAAVSIVQFEPLPPGVEFVRGDCNGDGQVNLTDAVRDLRFCFSDAAIPCAAACDTDGDGNPCTGVSDGVRLLMYLFRDGTPPPPPFPECGTVESDVDCETPPESCQ